MMNALRFGKTNTFDTDCPNQNYRCIPWGLLGVVKLGLDDHGNEDLDAVLAALYEFKFTDLLPQFPDSPFATRISIFKTKLLNT